MKVEITIPENRDGFYECHCGEKHFFPFIHISKGKQTSTYEFEEKYFPLVKSMFDTFEKDFKRSEVTPESMYEHSDGYKE